MAEFSVGIVVAEPRWAFLRRQRIMDLLQPDQVYLDRLRIVQTPWFGVFYHRIRMADTDRDLHSHPWNFWSLVLTGGYIEEMKHSPNGAVHTKKRRPLSLVRRMRYDWHIVKELRKSPTRTLIFVGKDHHDWQFLTPTGPVEHDDWLQQKRFERAWNKCTHYPDTECPKPWECSEVHNICTLHRGYTALEQFLQDQ